jgi:glycosyltransferase involved in cell wall biosynthesis
MISILMPIYNGIEFIEQSVNSIKNQKYSNWELIIGINGHPKDSEVYQIAKKYENEKIKIYEIFNTKGKSEALNEMLKFTNYNWIALLDVDDIWLPNKLQSQIQYIDKFDIIGTKCRYFGDSNVYLQIPTGDISKFNFLQVNPIINSSVLLKKKLCWWDKNHDGVEDYDLWLKLWRQKKTFYNVNSVEVLHRIHEQSAFNAQGNNLKVNDLLQKYM